MLPEAGAEKSTIEEWQLGIMLRRIEELKGWLVRRLVRRLGSAQQHIERWQVAEPFSEPETKPFGKVQPAGKQGRLSLQMQLDSLEDYATLQLRPSGGEYAGPIAIDRPLILDGQGATIWSLKGPVVSIESDRVSLCNLRIEVTGENSASSPSERSAIIVKSGEDLQLHNVEVRGTVMGIPAEEGDWNYPQALHLGQLAYGSEHDLLVRIVVPVPCQLISRIAGVDVQPNQLTPGAHEIRLQVDRLPQDTLIYGSIFLVSASLKRSITLSAKIQSLQDGSAGLVQGRIVWEPDNWSTLATGYRKQLLEPDSLSGTPDSLPLPQREVELPHSQTLAQPPRIKRDQKPPESSLFTTDEDGTKPIERTSSIPIFRDKPGGAFSLLNPDITKSEVEAQPDKPLVPQMFIEHDPGEQTQEASEDAIAPSVREPSRRGRSQPLRPIFEQTPAPSQPTEESDRGRKQESSPNRRAPDRSKFTKRKIVRSNNIPPIFGDSSKKE